MTRFDCGMRRHPLPDELAGPFSTRHARSLGVSVARLSARDLCAPFHGIRQRVAMADDTTGARCLAYAPRLTAAQFFSHVTAADLWDLPLPRSDERPLHVSAIPPAREPRTPGVIGHRLAMGFEHLTLRRGLPVPSIAETWAQLGGVLGVDRLVAAGDAILTRADADIDDLAAAAHRLRRQGAEKLRTALPLLRKGAESPRESIVRVILLSAGLPEPELNWTLTDGRGKFIARLDMAYPVFRVAVEYDGRQHTDVAQFRRDADRWPAIAAAGWLLIRVVDHHLVEPENRIIDPVRSALHSRGWRSDA
jgi:hypothetical protein